MSIETCERLREWFVQERASGLSIDSNQAGLAQRISERLYSERPTAPEHELVQEANERAAEVLPTAREAARGISMLRTGPTYCYLAFFGTKGRCRYVKVGMSSHPEGRVYSLTTGNPFDLLAIYGCRFVSRGEAFSAEQSLLRALESIHCRGEWVEIDECGADDIGAAAEGIAGALKMADGNRPRFEPLWILGRRIAA